MNTEQLREQIHAGIDRHCAPLTSDPYLVQRVLNAEVRQRGGIISMKKKFLISVVIVVLLFSVTALAAVFLTPKEIVEQTALPMAVESGSYGDVPNFTQEELATILGVAEENGICLSEYWYNALKSEDGVPKDELVKALAVSEFGDYMSWNIEEQFWFGEVMVALGYWAENPYRLPTEDEISYRDACIVVQSHILEKYQFDISSNSEYTLSVEYSCAVDEAGNKESEPLWWFYYTPKSLLNHAYEIKVNHVGEVVFSKVHKYNNNTSNEVIDAYSEVYGSVDKWTPEIWASFGESLKNSKSSGSLLVKCYLGANYCTPPTDGISREQAIQIALTAVNLENTESFVVFCCMENDIPIWKVVTNTLNPEDIGSGRYSATWMVEIDCLSGEILSKHEWNPETDKAVMLYTPFSVYMNLKKQDTDENHE